MTKSRLTVRVSDCSRVENKITGAEVKELSCQDVGKILSMNIEIIRN